MLVVELKVVRGEDKFQKSNEGFMSFIGGFQPGLWSDIFQGFFGCLDPHGDINVGVQ